jgi:cell division protein FtsL
MTRPRIRISTLMLLVIIAALAVALVIERRKSRQLLADAQAARAQAIEGEMYARAVAQAALNTQLRTNQKPPASPASPR